ncbi:MAG TPA: DUF1810 domain-containing protein [Ramlibacter sp.]|nr:DUF1810 domain-containing protein [Ramlibacter sp.]
MRAAHDLQPFLDAQSAVWTEVLDELRAGRKRSHWMWFVFPQLAVLGRSSMAKFYGLADAEEARAYLAHPVLGPRLLECCRLLLAVPDRSAAEILGAVDALKLRSCLTLFAHVAPGEPLFREVLARFCAGQEDTLTIEHLRS